MRRRIPLLALAVSLSLTAPAFAQEGGDPEVEEIKLSKEVVDLLASLPVQEDGRVKPLSTWASFKLLKLRGTRAAYTPGKRKLSPTEWLGHCLFFPEIAQHYEVFLVVDSDALDVIGMDHEGKKKRDRYSYRDLIPTRQALEDRARQIHTNAQEQGIQREKLERIDRQLVDLHENVVEFELLVSYLTFARFPVPTTSNPMIDAIFESKGQVPFSEALGKADKLLLVESRLRATGEHPLGPDHLEPTLAAMAQFKQGLAGVAKPSLLLSLFPPSVSAEEYPVWLTPRDITGAAFSENMAEVQPHLGLLAELETAVAAKREPGKLKKSLQRFHDGVVKLAEDRGEYARVPIEVSYYRWDFFYKALIFFMFGFVLIAISWTLKPGSRGDKWVPIVSLGLTGVGLGLTTAGIIFRCIIRQRPPVSTLYETILFIVAVLVCSSVLFMERINAPADRLLSVSAGARRGGGLPGLTSFEILEGPKDSMPSCCIAVLDTNFWLATHVVTDHDSATPPDMQGRA